MTASKLFPAQNSYEALQYPPSDRKCDWSYELVNISVHWEPPSEAKVWLVERVGQRFSHYEPLSDQKCDWSNELVNISVTTRQAEEDRLLWLLLQQSGALVNVHFETPPIVNWIWMLNEKYRKEKWHVGLSQKSRNR